jgi:hypothetical protein
MAQKEKEGKEHVSSRAYPSSTNSQTYSNSTDYAVKYPKSVEHVPSAPPSLYLNNFDYPKQYLDSGPIHYLDNTSYPDQSVIRNDFPYNLYPRPSEGSAFQTIRNNNVNPHRQPFENR